MDVLIQGKIVLKSFDVFANVGCATADVEQFDIFADKDGMIRITIIAIVENAMLSNIKIEPKGNASPLPPPSSSPPTPSPSPSTSVSNMLIDAGSTNEDAILAVGKTWAYAVPTSVTIKNTNQPDFSALTDRHRR